MEINIVLGDFLMEILVALVILGAGYWIWRNNSKKDSTVAEPAPYKVEATEVAPTEVVEAPAPVEALAPVVAESKPAKAPAKPRAKKPAATKAPKAEAKPKTEAKPKAPRKPKNLTVAK